MANSIVTLKIMPESPSIDLGKIESEVKKAIVKYDGEGETRTSIEPIAFGLKALKIIFVVDEKKGGTDNLEKNISKIKGVNSVEVVDVRRAIG